MGSIHVYNEYNHLMPSDASYILRNGQSCCGLSTPANELSIFVWKPRNLRNLKNLKFSEISKTTKLRFL